MSARDACSVIVAGEKKSTVLSSFKGNPGTFSIPAYRTGGEPPPAWVISAVCNWLGSVLRSVQESPPSFETKMGAVALAEPPGLGVKAEAARSCVLDRYNARKGSASCQVSPRRGTRAGRDRATAALSRRRTPTPMALDGLTRRLKKTIQPVCGDTRWGIAGAAWLTLSPGPVLTVEQLMLTGVTWGCQGCSGSVA